MKRVTLLAGFFLIHACVFGQISTDLIPKMAPSSPEAAAFTKYGNYDVNLFTGIPDISIPIYEIQIGQLKVPITLSYHASGIRVSDMASRAGLGWDLQAGGSITRKIMDKPDELPGNYLSATPTSLNRVRSQTEIHTSADSDLTYLQNAHYGYYDLQPDIFSYSFPGHGGKFLFNQKDSFKTFLIPSAPVVVNHSQPTASILYLDMTDESGIHYNFDSLEATSVGGGISVNSNSAWLLTKMRSSNQQDSITFAYTQSPYGFGLTDKYFSDYDVLNDAATGDYTSDAGTLYSDIGTIGTNWQQLNEIDFKNGKVVFEAATETRQDFGSIYRLQPRISAVKIYSYSAATSTYTLIRSVKFFHSYFITGTDTTTRRLRLDSIQVRSYTDVAVQTYKFSYNTSIGLPNNLSKEKDYWGFYNAQYNYDPNSVSPYTTTMVPKMLVSYRLNGNGSDSSIYIGGNNPNARITDSAYMQADILQQITYPTGGYTTFQYETNQYLDTGSTVRLAGGLRIKSISSYAGSSAMPIVKLYKYGLGESGYGRANFILTERFFMSVQNFRRTFEYNPIHQCVSPMPTKTTRTYYANPTNDLEGYDGATVVYPTVTEYQVNGSANNGKTVYTFLDKPDAKTDVIGLGKPIFDSYHFIRGLVTNKQVYRANSYGGYSLVTENRKGYQYFAYQWTTGGPGLVVYKKLISQSPTSSDIYCGNETYMDPCNRLGDEYNFQYNNYDIVSGDNKLIADSVITYDQLDSTRTDTVLTTYVYDDIKHLQDTLTQTTNSKNEIIKTTYTYPYNYTTSPYTTMTANHIYTAMVQETVNNSVSGQLTQKTNNYASFTGNNYLPSTIQLQVKSNAVETRASYNQYDVRGNILEMQKTNDVKQSYIWDYQGLMPVAEVINAKQSDIAYTSFESDGKGNWEFTGTPVNDPTAPTGTKSYDLSTGNKITKHGLNSSTTYIVSYWCHSGTNYISVYGSMVVKVGKTINGWTYYEHTVQGVSFDSIWGANSVDELRLYPATAQMTTYTYNPLVGMTSQTDMNGRTTYYQYDAIGRLALVKDQDYNVVKKICYDYFGQPAACDYTVVWNTAQSQTFTRNNCTGGYTPGTATYTVPANTYYSNTQTLADAVALNDISANGQNYANANATCTVPPSVTINSINSAGVSLFYAVYTNTATGVVTSFPVPSGGGTLGTVPQGIYNISISKSGNSTNYFFGVCPTGGMYAVPSANFYNISVSSSGCNTVKITP